VTVHLCSYDARYFEGVNALWQEAFPDDPPWNRAEMAVPEKVAFQPDLLIVAVERDQIIGTAMAGYDGHRGWLYAVAVLQSRRREGIGTALVREAEKRLNELGCGKINLQVRSTNLEVIAFYKGIGYSVEDRTSMGKRIRTPISPT
jgi:ribosomal protein S18 acetylase RimI-like enzyme